MYPVNGYNRELVISGNSLVQTPVEMLSSFEGSSPEAVAKRDGRVQYTDNLGLKYWIMCPVPCKQLKKEENGDLC